MTASDSYQPIIHCPLCDGPVHLDGAHEFVCQTGHRTSPSEVALHAEARLGEAMWMAIEALDTEATTLRLLSASDDAETYALDAEKQAELLREFGRRNADRRQHRENGSGGDASSN